MRGTPHCAVIARSSSDQYRGTSKSQAEIAEELGVDAPRDAFRPTGLGWDLREMERQQRINEDVLRFLTVKVDALNEEPSPIIARKDRDDRGKRDRDEGGFGGGGFGDRPPRSFGDRDRGDRPPREDRGDRPPRPPRGDR